MRSLNEIGQAALVTSMANGYKPDNPIEKIALCHSELSEALEYARTGNYESWVTFDGKPKGFGTELADTIVRVCELAAICGVDLDEWVSIKMDYNRTRPDVPARGGKKLV